MRLNQECVESRGVGVETVAEVARVVDWVAHPSRRDSLEAVPKQSPRRIRKYRACGTFRVSRVRNLQVRIFNKSQVAPVPT